MKLKLNPNIKNVINIIAMVLLMIVVIISLMRNVELSSERNKLNSRINTQENVIYELSNDNEILRNNITQLNIANEKLQEANFLLEYEIQSMSTKIEQLENELQTKKNTSEVPRRDFKSYMSYKAITNQSSRQWALQQKATTNEDGIRCIDGIPLVAIGTGWGLKVGDIGLVTCENGNSFKVMMGDIKSDRHTDAERKTTVDNGCRCEFIVDVPKIDSTARVMGSMAVLSKYSGYVVNIEKVN